MTQDQIQEMMDRIQELMEQGRMEEAQELLRQLQDMLENMQIVEQQGGGGQGEGLQDTLREQQDLADETFRELQEQFDQQNGQQNGQDGDNQAQGNDQDEGESGSEQNRPGSNGQANSDGLSDLAERQNALRQMLEDQRGGLQNPGGEAGQLADESLDDAEGNMRGAEDAIRDGDLGEALNEQAEALDNLRRGLRALNDQRRAENSQSDGNGQGDTAADGQSGRGDENDPLGRSRNGQENGGSALSGTQDQIGDLDRFEEVNRLRDQLLEKLEERERPNYELDYFDRLLERFK